MADSSDVQQKNALSNFIWSVADLLRGPYRKTQYERVVLPLVVLRRLDAVLDGKRDEIRAEYLRLKEKGMDEAAMDKRLNHVAGQRFHNRSGLSFAVLKNDPDRTREHIEDYIEGFDAHVREIFARFTFRDEIQRMDEFNVLHLVVSSFADIDLHPDTVDTTVMGLVFEDLIRRFNEAANETAGDHFTPRDVVGLLVRLLFEPDRELQTGDPRVVEILDPTCGTGGMLAEAHRYLEEHYPEVRPYLYGQDFNPRAYAIAASDLLLKFDPENPAASNSTVELGDSLVDDAYPEKQFEYFLANPPFGVDWKRQKSDVERERKKLGYGGRFGAGTPRVSDGALLFLQHMVSKMESPAGGRGSRVAVVFNGSPLFTGDAGSGESEIRRWIIENDWLEAIVGLPENLFYNTGIRTYIWVLSNRKPTEREGTVQLIDARDLYAEMDESLGDKRHYLTGEHIGEIASLFGDLEANGRSVVLDNADFGYRRIVIDQPLRLRFQVTEERIAALDDERAFTNRDEETQARVKEALSEMDSEQVWMDRAEFLDDVELKLNMAGLDLRQSVYNAITRVTGERDPEAEICRKANGDPEHDGDRREKERVPLGTDPREYFEEEVAPYLEEAWINESSKYHDEQDGELGVVGYEINFNRYFYEYEPPRPLEEIDEDIRQLRDEITQHLAEVTE